MVLSMAIYFRAKLLLFVASVFIIIPLNRANAQEGSTGSIYEKTFIKKTKGVEIFNDSFSVQNLETSHFLTINALDKATNSVSIFVNGIRLAEISRPAFNHRHLVKLSLQKNNTIEVRLSGGKKSAVMVKVLQMSNFYSILGPEALIKDKKTKISYSKKFVAPNPRSQHLLVVEVGSQIQSLRDLVLIKLNNKIVVNPLDFIFDKNKRFMKTISVTEENKLEVFLLGSSKYELKISIMAATDTEDIASPGRLKLVNVDSKTFNPVGSTVLVDLEGASFPALNQAITVIANDRILEGDQFFVSGNRITIPNLLSDGKNDLQIMTFDSDGGGLSLDESIWAGSNTVRVHVYRNNTLLTNSDVVAELADDKAVKVTVSSNQFGIAEVSNIPIRTIFFTAKYQNQARTSVEVINSNADINLSFNSQSVASDIDNNKFEVGLQGWDVSRASSVELVPHVEDNISDILAFSAKPLVATRSESIASMTYEEQRAYRGRMNQSLKAVVKSSSLMSPLDQDNDLSLSTGGVLGPSEVSRTFRTKVGTQFVKIRYKFISSEIPGGYFGTNWNDGYYVYMGSREGYFQDAKSMNTMGLSAFTANGASDWMELYLPVMTVGDTVDLYASVSNVGDSNYDSQIVIDYVEETPFAIKRAELFDLDMSLLQYMSVSSLNPYMDGKTIIGGDIEITGPENDELKSVSLQLIQGGFVRATADLAPAHMSSLGKFDSSHSKVLFGHIFQLSTLQAGLIDTKLNSNLIVRVIAESKNGLKAVYTFDRPMELLTRSDLSAASRYGSERDLFYGGDDWGTPSCVQTINDLINTFSGIGFKVNDYSNMNGGQFSPHSTHQEGVDVDFVFNGSNRVDALAAQRLLQVISRGFSNISLVGVTYNKVDGDPFYDTLKRDGSPAARKIAKWENHRDHFHIRCIK